MRIKYRLLLALLPLLALPVVAGLWLLAQMRADLDRDFESLVYEEDASSPVALKVAQIREENARSIDLYAKTVLLLAFILAVGGFCLAQRFSSPLVRLSQAVSRLNSAEATALLETNARQDEIGELSRCVGEMNERLRTHVENLDTQLSDKTKQLRRAIDYLKAEVAERASAERRSRRANAQKSEFLSHMSHEIRTPMNGVLGVADELLSMELGTDERQRVEMIRFSSENMIRLLDDILDFSKIEAGQLDVKNESYDFELACRSVHMLFMAKAKAKGLDYRIAIAKSVPKFALGDSMRVRQIISNLLSNAIKFTEVGGVELRIETETRRKDGLLITVSDTGIGIAEQLQDGLFEPFTQLASNTNEPGTGLGLVISLKLAKLMGGEISYRSEAGEGSEFRFWMPYLEGVPVQDSTEWPESVEPIENVRVLIVEDNLINQHVISSALERANHQISLASDGTEALEILDEQPFDLIFMDCRMPEMNGFETTSRIRSFPEGHMNRDTPIVALTANAFPEDRRRCFECGMNNFLAKPAKRHTLLKIVNFYGHQAINASPFEK